MCVALDGDGSSGVCGSPGNSLEAFSLSTEKVVYSYEFLTSCGCAWSLSLSFCLVTQSVMEKRFSVELKNSGVADVAVRADSKIMASGGWDGR